MIYLLEETRIKTDVAIAEKISMNNEVDTLRFNVGPSVIQTLSISEKLWMQSLTGNPKELIIAQDS